MYNVYYCVTEPTGVVCLSENVVICVDLQVVGNLIYYRYMNPAIVAPDAFDIVSFGVDKGLTPDQVHPLSSCVFFLILHSCRGQFA